MATLLSFTQSTPGNYSFEVPLTVSTLVIECWGPGGTGTISGSSVTPGQGGGGGGYARKTVSIPAGSIIDYTVGASTYNPGTPTATPAAWTFAVLRSTGEVLARVGPGSNAVNDPVGGGSNVNDVYDVRYQGGTGVLGNPNTNGSAGGGGAGNAGNGANGQFTVGGAGGISSTETSPANLTGGAGGKGADKDGTPIAPGGGAAGSKSTESRKFGAAGRIRMHYPDPRRIILIS
jgi:hypothetical protein